jgi:hypothetical protein
MSILVEHILKRASERSEGEVLLPKEFLHLASRAAVDQALSRLTREGKLMRVARGTYVAPVVGRFGERPPSPEKAIQSLAQKSGETVVAHGAAAANALGLTTQVPVREVFLTTGRSRRLRFGARSVELKHAPSWQLALGDTPAGAAVRAIAWLGPSHAGEGLAKLRKRLAPAEWKTLVAARAALPAWMAKAVGEAGVPASANG